MSEVPVDMDKLNGIISGTGMTLSVLSDSIGVPVVPVMQAEDKANLWETIRAGKRVLSEWRTCFPHAKITRITNGKEEKEVKG